MQIMILFLAVTESCVQGAELLSVVLQDPFESDRRNPTIASQFSSFIIGFVALSTNFILYWICPV